MKSASLKISNFSFVISPITLIPKPGPGKGCLYKKASSKPSSFPKLLTLSLYKVFKGSSKLKPKSLGRPPTL